jgi:serine/threonine protein kinase
MSFHLQYRAPEEKLDLPQDEKVDVWALGGQLYGLLTGLRPYYWDDWRGFKKKVRKGIRPYVDKRYYNRSYAETELIKIMKQTWEKDAESRISIFDIVRRLHQVRDEIHKQNNN